MGEKPAPPILLGTRGSDHVLIESSHKIVAGWLQAQISVHCGGLSAHFDGRFRHGELHRFGKDLEDLYSGQRCTAGLKPIEPYLVLLLRSDGHGQVHIAGEVRQKPESKNILSFELEVDQADLRVASNSLILADSAA